MAAIPARSVVLGVILLAGGLFPAALAARDATLRTGPRWLFEDGLAPGFHDTSWALDAIEDHFVHGGSRAIEVIPGRNGAFRISFAPARFVASDRLGFWIDSAEPERIALRAMIWRGDHEELGPPVPIRGHLLAGAGGALDSVWRRGAIPTSLLAPAGSAITGFVWQAPNDDRAAPFYLDDIALLPRDAALPVLSECTAAPPIEGFVRRQGGALWVDGTPFRAMGANMYFLQQQFSRYLQTGDPRPLSEARAALDAAACAGATVVRLIGFNDSPLDSGDTTVIQTAPGVYREAGLRGLDLALTEAREHHLRVILTLTNNWTAFGGLPRYAEWAHVPSADAVQMFEVREWVADYARMCRARQHLHRGCLPRRSDDPGDRAGERAALPPLHDRRGRDILPTCAGP